MGYTSDSTTLATAITWGDPSFLQSKDQVLICYWTKIASYFSDWTNTGIRKVVPDGSKGWQIIHDTVGIALFTYPESYVTPSAGSVTGVNDNAWHQIAVYIDNRTGLNCRFFKDGSEIGSGSIGTQALTHITNLLTADMRTSNETIAELSAWATSDGSLGNGLAGSNAYTIQSKLASQTPRNATDITELAVNFYAPLISNLNDVVTSITGTGDAHTVVGSHPWGLTATRGRVSWAELQAANIPTKGRLSWAELAIVPQLNRGFLGCGIGTSGDLLG